MRSRVTPALLAIALIATACDQPAPTSLDEQMSEQAFAQVAEAALNANDQSGVPLPSHERLLRLTLKTIHDQGGHEEGQRILRRARFLARKAQESLEAGDAPAAQQFRTKSYLRTLDAIIVVLGEDVVVEALAGVNQAIVRLDERLAEKSLPTRIERMLDRIHSMADASGATLSEGNHRRSLVISLNAATMIRALSPRYQAHKAIQRATRALEAAFTAVGDTPNEDEVSALRRARRLLRSARDAFAAKEYRKAMRRATESTRISLEVIQDRST